MSEEEKEQDQEGEDVEDFISLWRKKMLDESKSPSVIGDTLDKVEKLEKENDYLKTKIEDNVDLIKKTEERVKRIIEERDLLREQKQQAVEEVNLKVQMLEQKIKEQQELVDAKEEKIAELRNQINEVSKESSPDLIEDIKSELAKKKAQINALQEKLNDKENEIQNLRKENQKLEGKLNEKSEESLSAIESIDPTESEEQPTQDQSSISSGSKALEYLCQDLQSELNKYKRIVTNLKKENKKLKKVVDSEGGLSEFEEEKIEELESENKRLRQQISELENLAESSTPNAPDIEAMEQKIADLQDKLQIKDQKIESLRSEAKEKAPKYSGPMSGLIDDLQSKINKLKITIKEKNKTIEELKSS